MYSIFSDGLNSIFGDERMSLYEIWSAVLLFGNIQIEAIPDKDASRVINPEIIEKIANLLKINPKRIEDALIMLNKSILIDFTQKRKQ